MDGGGVRSHVAPDVSVRENQDTTTVTFAEAPSITERDYDLIVVGGGIVGVAAAREIQMRHRALRIAVVEKELGLAKHQSGHNSGVVHAGIYYKPGTLKARLCVEGMQLAYKYFEERGVPHKKCGKLIVATDESEVERLMELYERGLQNNVPELQLIDGDKIKEIEPHCEGVKAIWSPQTGIVDWAQVTEYYGMDFKAAGGVIFAQFRVREFTESKDPGCEEYPITLHAPRGVLRARYVLTCAGLQSDLVAEMTGCPRAPRILPFRGEYLLLDQSKCHMVRGNIYPVPNPKLPFLGVHFTPRMDGSVWLGPNAVLAFEREGYRWSNIHLAELFDALRYPGFIKLAWRNMRFGMGEVIRSMFPWLVLKDLQKYIPELHEFDITRGPAGVRAQALDLDGNLVDDFVFDRGVGDSPIAKRVMHCRNAPSPGATSSLAIAKMVADKVEQEFGIGKTSTEANTPNEAQ